MISKYIKTKGDPENWIPKEDLIAGQDYLGKSRNTEIAYWDGSKFEYGISGDTLNCPEDMDEPHEDVFFPLEISYIEAPFPVLGGFKP